MVDVVVGATNIDDAFELFREGPKAFDAGFPVTYMFISKQYQYVKILHKRVARTGSVWLDELEELGTHMRILFGLALTILPFLPYFMTG